MAAGRTLPIVTNVKGRCVVSFMTAHSDIDRPQRRSIRPFSGLPVGIYWLGALAISLAMWVGLIELGLWMWR